MSYRAPPYATFAFPPLSWIALIPSITIDSFTSIPPKPPEKSPNAIEKKCNRASVRQTMYIIFKTSLFSGT